MLSPTGVLSPMLLRVSTLIFPVTFLKTPGPYLRLQTTTDKRKNFSKIYPQMGQASSQMFNISVPDYRFGGVSNYQLARGARISRFVPF